MTHPIGAQLTALSVPGYGYVFNTYFGRFGAAPGYWRGISPYGRVIFGAEAPMTLPERRGLTASLAPIVAPATGGVLVRNRFDENQVLHVEICVDDMCHSTSMDLAPAIATLLGKLKSVHDQWHASQTEPRDTVIQSAVNAAQEMMVGALVDQHVSTVTSGILDSITDVVKAISPFGLAMKVKPVADILRKFKGPISAAAGIAAAAGATAIPGVGPFVAPVAGKLAGDLVNSSLGDPAAQRTVAQAKQQSQTDPQIAAALDQATKAVANTTAAYSVQDTANRAEAGDQAAQQEIVTVAEDAKQGDPAAKAVADLLASAMKSEWGAKLWEQVTGRGPGTISGWHDITVGQDIERFPCPSSVRYACEKARAHAITIRGNAAAVIVTLDGRVHGRGFGRLDDAMAWLQHITRNRDSFAYAAAFSKDSDGNAYVESQVPLR